MAIESLGITTTATASAADVLDIAAGTNNAVRLMELHIYLNTAVATKLALFRTTALGTRTSPTTLGAEDPNDETTPISTIALAWSVAATKASIALRRISLPATIGAGIIWTWGPRGLLIPKAGSLILSNTAGAVIGLCDVNAIVDI